MESCTILHIEQNPVAHICVSWVRILFIASQGRLHCLRTLRNIFHSKMAVIWNLHSCLWLQRPDTTPNVQNWISVGGPRHLNLLPQVILCTAQVCGCSGVSSWSQQNSVEDDANIMDRRNQFYNAFQLEAHHGDSQPKTLLHENWPNLWRKMLKSKRFASVLWAGNPWTEWGSSLTCMPKGHFMHWLLGVGGRLENGRWLMGCEYWMWRALNTSFCSSI